MNNHENYRAQNVRPARKYVETHGPEIIKELYQLARELEKMMKERGKGARSGPAFLSGLR